MSVMSRLRMVSWPMRSRGEKMDSVFSMLSRSGMEGEVGRLGVEDRVVVAAAQVQRVTSPVMGLATQRCADSRSMMACGVEPAALIEEAAEFAAVVAVLFDGVFVVDAGDEALVGDEEQGESGRFVDAADLASMMRFSI